MKTRKLLVKFFLFTLIIGINEHINAQASFVGHGGFFLPTDWCGWGAATPIPFALEHRGTQDIIFRLGGAGPAFQRMTILGTASGTPGFVGIGTNFPTPLHLLDVRNGDINVGNGSGTSPQGYMIGDNYVLRHTGDISCIFGGVFAGFSNTIGGSSNTAFGFSALKTNSTATNNTAVGANALQLVTTGGDDNTAVGAQALRDNTAHGNTAVGSAALFVNTTGLQNTAVGFHTIWQASSPLSQENTAIGADAMASNRTGHNNVAVGDDAMTNSRNGNFNVAVGSEALSFSFFGNQTTAIGYRTLFQTTSNDRNVALGYYAGFGNMAGTANTVIGTLSDMSMPNLFNSSAIGYRAVVTANHNMILGNDSVWVGIGLSNIPGGPQNTLEINATTIGTGVPVANSSGLRFRQLTCASPTVPNCGTMGVLAVDNSGNVIYVPGGTVGAVTGAQNGCSLSTINPTTDVVLGQDVGQIGAPATLLNNREIPMNNFSLFLTDPATPVSGTNRIQMSSFFALGSISKMTVANIHSAFPGRIGGTFSTAFQLPPVSLASNPYYLGSISLSKKIGVVALGIDSVGNGNAVAGLTALGFINNGVSQAFGVFGAATGSTTRNIGVQGHADGASSSLNVGGAFSATGSPTSNIAVNATAPLTNGSYAVFTDGDIFINSGNSSTVGFVNGTSDQMFKTHIDTISNPLSIIKRLKPRTFFFDTANNYNLHFNGKRQYGFIAQDVQTVLPELVGISTKPAERDTLGNITVQAVTYKNLNYNAFIALLTSALQKQQNTMDSMRTAMQQMNQTLNSCCSSNLNGNGHGNGSRTIAVQNVELSDADAIVLNQNVPNPYAEQTTITYNVPTKYTAAQILFYDSNGRLIKSVDVTKGKGQLNVYANDLTNGIYSYTLIVDGKIMDTKKMVKQN